MKIEIVVDPARPAPAASLASRVAPAAAAPAAVPQAQTARTGGPRGRRVGRTAAGGSRIRKSERPPKSAADLDAEMEDYTASNAPAA